MYDVFMKLKLQCFHLTVVVSNHLVTLFGCVDIDQLKYFVLLIYHIILISLTQIIANCGYIVSR